MSNLKLATMLFLSCPLLLAQAGGSASAAAGLQAPTTLPIVFTSGANAAHAHAGDPITAKTTQVLHLANGVDIPSGAKVLGHVVAANPFVYDRTPYAHQKSSTLSIQFDSVQLHGTRLPLKVTVRAMADPITSEEARTPNMPHDADPQGTVSQIGGDQLTPSQHEVVSRDGDVVAYNKRGGVYAHLIANDGCDGSNVEVPMGIYSASACGLYGFVSVSAAQMGSESAPSTLSLVSTHVSPRIWKESTALLEVLPGQKNIASR